MFKYGLYVANAKDHNDIKQFVGFHYKPTDTDVEKLKLKFITETKAEVDSFVIKEASQDMIEWFYKIVNGVGI